MTVLELFEQVDFDSIGREIAKKMPEILYDTQKNKTEKEKIIEAVKEKVKEAVEEMIRLPVRQSKDDIILCVWIENVYNPGSDNEFNESFLEASVVSKRELQEKTIFEEGMKIEPGKEYEDELFLRSGFEFSDWEDILGWEVAKSSVSAYGAAAVAAAIFTQMTYFGLFYENCNSRKREVIQSIDEAMNQLEDSSCTRIELEEEFEMEEESEKEKREREAFEKAQNDKNQKEIIEMLKNVQKEIQEK